MSPFKPIFPNRVQKNVNYKPKTEFEKNLSDAIVFNELDKILSVTSDNK